MSDHRQITLYSSEDHVLSTVKSLGGVCSPALLHYTLRDACVDSGEIAAAVWRLIGDGRLVLTGGLDLRLPDAQ